MTGRVHGVVLLLALFAAIITQQQLTAVAQTSSNSIFYSFPDRGGFSVQSTGGSGSVSVGYARVDPGGGTTGPAGVAIFGFRPNGVLVTETSVPAMLPVLSGRTYAEVSARIDTGIAFVNPNAFPVTISFYFTDQNGNQSGQNSLTLNADTQIARFLNEVPFNAGTSFAGTFTFNASAAVGVISLRGLTNERGDFLIATQPVAPITVDTATPVLLAHFADGGGWKTQVLLVNPTDSPISGTVQFFSEGNGTAAATPLTLTVNGQTGSSFSYNIATHSSLSLATSGSGSLTQTGSVQVTPPSGLNAPSGFAVLSFGTNGVTVTQASVAAEPITRVFRMYVESNGSVGSSGSIDSGIAITNTSTTPATVNLDVTKLDGSSTGFSTLVTVPALGHASKFLSELFPALPRPFQGVLRINADITPISVVGLRTRYNERNEFLITTTPPSNELSNSSTAELIFPHFVNMGGYTTQFILFSGVQYQSAVGTINFFDQTGQAINITYR